MRFLALFLVGTVGFLLTMIIKTEVDFHYRRRNQEDNIDVDLRALGGLWHFHLQVPTIDLAWEKGPELVMEQAAQPEAAAPRKRKMVGRFRYWSGAFFYRLWPNIPTLLFRLNRVKQKFYKGIHMTALELQFEVGFTNPAHTALAVGGMWTVIGNAVARLHRQVQVEVARPVVMVAPNFQKAGFACNFHCIFKMRIGHIMVAGLNLLRVFIWGARR